MPVTSITTTAQDVFFGNAQLDSLNFKNGSASGTIFIRNKQQTTGVVTSSDHEWSLGAGESLGVSRSIDGSGVIGPWAAISDTGGGVDLNILALYRDGKKGT